MNKKDKDTIKRSLIKVGLKLLPVVLLSVILIFTPTEYRDEVINVFKIVSSLVDTTITIGE